jgi:hypothetical protein
MTMQSARDQLLAGAGFAGDQYGGIRLGETADGAKDFLHRRRLAEDLGTRRLLDGGRFALAALLERAPNQLNGVVDVEGLRQISTRHPGMPKPRIEVSGCHYDHRDRGCFSFTR